MSYQRFCLPFRRSAGYCRFRTCHLCGLPEVWPALVGAPANGGYLPPTRLFSLQNMHTPPSRGRAFSTAFLPAPRCRSLFSQLFPRFWSLWHLQALCSRFLCFFEGHLGLLAPPSKFSLLSASTLSPKILCRECKWPLFGPNTEHVDVVYKQRQPIQGLEVCSALVAFQVVYFEYIRNEVVFPAVF